MIALNKLEKVNLEITFIISAQRKMSELCSFFIRHFLELLRCQGSAPIATGCSKILVVWEEDSI